jgi:hypothetical protein
MFNNRYGSKEFSLEKSDDGDKSTIRKMNDSSVHNILDYSLDAG